MLGITLRTVVTIGVSTLCTTGWCGGETPVTRGPIAIPQSSRVPGSGFRPHTLISKNPPSAAPYRPVGWGYNCHEAYGPTYYYPSYTAYEGLHPQYYPFFKPRLWPNYKTDALAGGQCGASRSCWFWDSYDDWMRDSRYGERQ